MSINTIIVSGHIGKDAVLRQTPNGKFISSFSIPATSGFGDKQKTSWLTCKMFGGAAEKLTQYLVKGAKVTVCGEFVMDEWQKDSGEKVQMATILVRDIELPAKAIGSAGSGQQKNGAQAGSNPPMDFDEDIPFAPIGLQYGKSAIYVI